MKQKKYITLKEGCDFRTIAKIKSQNGYPMNHATARNVLMSAMKNLFYHSSNEIKQSLNEKQLEEMMKDQKVYDALSDVLYSAYNSLDEEKGKQ